MREHLYLIRWLSTKLLSKSTNGQDEDEAAIQRWLRNNMSTVPMTNILGEKKIIQAPCEITYFFNLTPTVPSTVTKQHSTRQNPALTIRNTWCIKNTYLALFTDYLVSCKDVPSLFVSSHNRARFWVSYGVNLFLFPRPFSVPGKRQF